MTDKEIMEYIGRRIKSFRRNMKISQTKLANELGCSSPHSVHKIENGEMDIRATDIVKICKLFKIDVSILLPKI